MTRYNTQLYTIVGIFLLTFSIVTMPLFTEVYAYPQKTQELETHLNQSMTALNNNDVEGAKMHLQLAQQQLSSMGMKDGNKTSMMTDNNMTSTMTQ